MNLVTGLETLGRGLPSTTARAVTKFPISPSARRFLPPAPAMFFCFTPSATPSTIEDKQFHYRVLKIETNLIEMCD